MWRRKRSIRKYGGGRGRECEGGQRGGRECEGGGIGGGIGGGRGGRGGGIGLTGMAGVSLVRCESSRTTCSLHCQQTALNRPLCNPHE